MRVETVRKKREREGGKRKGKRKERREESEVGDPLKRSLYPYVQEKEVMRRKAANERTR
jgi:hypothetical protein